MDDQLLDKFYCIHIFPKSQSTRELHIFFISCHLRHWGTLWRWSYQLAALAFAVDAAARADASHWLMQSLYPPVGAKAILLFFLVFPGADWKSPIGIVLPHLLLQLISIHSNLFYFTSTCVTHFKFAFELKRRCPSLFVPPLYPSLARVFFLPLYCVPNMPLLASCGLHAHISNGRCVARVNVLFAGAWPIQTRLSVQAGFAKLHSFPSRFLDSFSLDCQFE